ncbi:MAG: hypothetical protein IPF47_21675 [Gemmatimonadetes bacterium]|nr:hypothetical protein [Gemmatimonadota bacterium]
MRTPVRAARRPPSSRPSCRGRAEDLDHEYLAPLVTRSFATVGEAARENAVSRVYVGYHFRRATEVGLDQGRQVGRHVVANSLRRLTVR